MEKKNKIRIAKIGGIALFNLVLLFSVVYSIVMTVEPKQASSSETDTRVIDEFEGPKKGSGSGAETQAPSPAVVLVDDFEGAAAIKNKLGSRANVYIRPPSRVMISKRDDVINGKNTKVLMIKYDKKNTGGPYGAGGWCGYYTLIKNDRKGRYFDGTDYSYLTFWVKGETGEENFMVGLADEHWDKIEDSVKSDVIGEYLEAEKITTEWQKARVPLDAFFLDYATLSSASINFEGSCFPEGAHAGSVFIDDIALEK